MQSLLIRSKNCSSYHHHQYVKLRSQILRFYVCQESDFFGEPVTFLNNEKKNNDPKNDLNVTHDKTDRNRDTNIQKLMSLHDEYLLGVLSRGKSCSGGGGDEGIEVQSAHSMAMVFAPYLSMLQNYQQQHKKTVPRLVVSAVMPILVNAGVQYLQKIDNLFRHTTTPEVQLLEMANDAISILNEPTLSKQITPPEMLHLEALQYMVNDQQMEALNKLLVLLTRSPGDALAIHCALELSFTLGSKSSALNVSGCSSTYWSERARNSGSGILNTPGYYLGSSMIALGFAVGNTGSSLQSAEGLGVAAQSNDAEMSGSVSAYALCNVYDAEGRSSEGQSTLIGSDGSQNVDGAGWMFFDSKLMGLGARFVLARDGMRAPETALRLYDIAFRRVLSLHLKTDGVILRKSPGNERTGMRGIFNRLNPFHQNQSSIDNDSLTSEQQQEMQIANQIHEEYVIEDVLTWLPPTLSLVTDATLLLLNLTVYGFVKADDLRWSELRKMWIKALSEEETSTLSDNSFSLRSLQNRPLTYAACSLLLRDSDNASIHSYIQPNVNEILFEAGTALGLGNPIANTESKTSAEWSKISQSLYSLYPVIRSWNSETRFLLERLICYVSCQTDDYNGICVARSLCSEAITLRSNSPDVWWRYSLVLDKLGDYDAAESARNTSYSLGKGEGGNISSF